MPRTSISTEYRNSIEEQNSSECDLIFVTIEHASLSEPIRVVNDVAMPNGQPIQYSRDGRTFIGLPFSLSLVNDDDAPPRGRVELANVAQDIGLSIDALSESPDVTLEVMKLSDFTRGSAPNDHIWTVANSPDSDPELIIENLRLENIQLDEMIVSADLVSYDLTREPWGRRATKSRFPGLFW